VLLPVNSIGAEMANEFTDADTELYRSSLIALAFLLFVVTFVILSLAKLMLLRIERLSGRTN
jgi:phosphate transport system permease protein